MPVLFWVFAALTCVLAFAAGSRSEVDAGLALVFCFLTVLGGGFTLLLTIGAKRALAAVGVRYFLGLLARRSEMFSPGAVRTEPLDSVRPGLSPAASRASTISFCTPSGTGPSV